jgi:hypothetical protein
LFRWPFICSFVAGEGGSERGCPFDSRRHQKAGDAYAVHYVGLTGRVADQMATTTFAVLANFPRHQMKEAAPASKKCPAFLAGVQGDDLTIDRKRNST